jgi:hypothetical protein
MLKFRFLRVKILISHHSPWSNPIFHAISRLRDFVLQLQRVEHPGAARWRGGSSIEKPGDSHRKAYEISFVMIILRYIIRYIYMYIYISHSPWKQSSTSTSVSVFAASSSPFQGEAVTVSASLTCWSSQKGEQVRRIRQGIPHINIYHI